MPAKIKRLLQSIKRNMQDGKFDTYIVAKDCGMSIYEVYDNVIELRKYIPDLPEPVESLNV